MQNREQIDSAALGERKVYPPFTERYVFSGPSVAISCEVDFDKEEGCWTASSSAGFKSTGESACGAALNLFKAWMTHDKAWFEPEPMDMREMMLREMVAHGDGTPGTCNLPPEGWYCTLAHGHDGPCPTWPRYINGG